MSSVIKAADFHPCFIILSFFIFYGLLVAKFTRSFFFYRGTLMIIFDVPGSI